MIRGFYFLQGTIRDYFGFVLQHSNGHLYDLITNRSKQFILKLSLPRILQFTCLDIIILVAANGLIQSIVFCRVM